MADVLIVCVREDEPRAKALAEMFEAAGFSIGGAPGSDGALRSSGAGLVVWSQASIRSRPFLDAAQRVINAEKAVVASLIEPPPPSSIGDSPVFDLSRWDGDPNDPSLDPLFFAVDRMVNSARAGVGATTQAEPRGYEPPAPSYEPPPRAARPPAEPKANFARGASPGDPLGSEAEHWRAIRDSRNPSDFMDYLARYGAEGAFAEVAELRLKQLTQSSGSEARSSAPSQRPLTPPASRPTLPSRPLESTRRLDAPPMRRAEPAPLRRPPTDRGFDRNDLREPRAEGNGSPMRAFILIALLGGAALAGGLYFGGGIPNFASAPEREQVADVGATTPFDEPSDMLDEPVGVPLEDSTAPAPAPDRRAEARREEARREEARREEARREPAPTRPTEAPPAPTTSWAANNGTGGPTSLSPGSSAPATNATPPVPVPLNPSVTAASAPTNRGSTRPAGNVVWSQRPSARRVADLYPDRASREGVGGRVELDCSVRSNQTLACSVSNESPSGLGFGRAALSAAGSYRAQPWLSDGTDSTGARTRVVFQFNAPEQ
jgi:hypothetical protein